MKPAKILDLSALAAALFVLLTFIGNATSMSMSTMALTYVIVVIFMAGVVTYSD